MAFLTGLILLSQMVNAEVPHENYEDADLDLISVAYYLQSSFEMLNITIWNVNELRLTEAMGNSLNFSLMIESARKTLRSLPEDVDSYEILSDSIDSLGKTEKDLSNLIEGLEKVLSAIEDLKGYSFDVWTRDSIGENLTEAINSVLELPKALSSMEEGRTYLIQDIERFTSFDITGSWDETWELEIGTDTIIEGLIEIEDVISNLEENLTSPETIIHDLFRTPLGELDRGMESLLMEVEPALDLIEIIEIIEYSEKNLPDPYSKIILGYTDLLALGSVSVERFHDNQMVFLENITRLETEANISLFTNVEIMDVCFSSLEGMTMSMEELETVVNGFGDMENGTIAETSMEIHELLEEYKKRLEGIDDNGIDLQELADSIDIILHANLIEPDLDGDGNLSQSEIRQLPLEFIPEDLAGSVIDNIEMAIKALQGVPPVYLTELKEVLPMLRSAAISAWLLSFSHQRLINDLMVLNEGALEEIEDWNWQTTMGLILKMESNAGSILRAEELMEPYGLNFSKEWSEELPKLLDLYRVFLLKVRPDENEPMIMVSFERSQVPYDTNLSYSILAIDVDPLNGSFLPDGRMITLDFDDRAPVNVSLVHGSYTGWMFIDGEMSLGAHFLNVSMITLSGNLTVSSSEFNVRKIDTTVRIDPANEEAMTGDGVEISIGIVDEFLREMNVNLTVRPMMETYPSPSNLTLFNLPLGISNVTAEFKGNDHYSGDLAVASILVKQEPVITISSNGDHFGRNDTINITTGMEQGNGTVTLSIDGVGVSSFELDAGKQHHIQFDPNELGNGTYAFQASFISGEDFTVDGRSGQIDITILLEIDPEPVEDQDDDDDPIIEDDLPFPENDDERVLDDRMEWIIFSIVIILFSFISLFYIVRRRNLRTGKKEMERFHLPKVYVRRRIRTDLPEEERFEKIDRKNLTRKAEDPAREKMIKEYLEVIRNSPGEIGLSRSMTPREVGERLIEYGLSEDIARSISDDFELSIYKLGIPEKDNIERFSGNRGKVSSWFDGFIRRIGLGDEEGDDR